MGPVTLCDVVSAGVKAAKATGAAAAHTGELGARDGARDDVGNRLPVPFNAVATLSSVSASTGFTASLAIGCLRERSLKFQNGRIGMMFQEVMVASPTQQAQQQFRHAHGMFTQVFSAENSKEHEVADGIREGLKGLALGMDQLAVGLRATYQLLEKMQAEIENLKRQRPGP